MCGSGLMAVPDKTTIAEGSDKMRAMNDHRLAECDKGKRPMDDVLETNDLALRAFPIGRYGSVKAAQNAAVRFIGPLVAKPFTYRRARSIWEKTARRIDGAEKDAFRMAAAVERARKRGEALQLIEDDRREQQELRTRLASLDARLTSVDEAFFGPTLAALREQESGLGRVHYDGKDK